MNKTKSMIPVKIIALLIALTVGISAVVCASAVSFDINEAPGITDNEELVSYIHDTLLDLMLNWDGSTLPEINIKSLSEEGGYNTPNIF